MVMMGQPWDNSSNQAGDFRLVEVWTPCGQPPCEKRPATIISTRRTWQRQMSAEFSIVRMASTKFRKKWDSCGEAEGI